MHDFLEKVILKIASFDGINDKAKLSEKISYEFSLTRDRSVFYNEHVAIRFSKANNVSFSNTVLSLSNLKKYDDKPFIVCIVTPKKNYLLLANSTFIKKISHSSQELRVDNIRGSFNGSDIAKEFEGILNNSKNLERLFNIHSGISFEENLHRLVDSTNSIIPKGVRQNFSDGEIKQLLNAPSRAMKFCASENFSTLKKELDQKVAEFKNEIMLAAFIENINVRGRIIEYLIAGENIKLRQEIITALKEKSQNIPPFKTDNNLGDYSKEFEDYLTETDVKTKILLLNSNPKAYNIDKLLRFLCLDRSVFMFYFIGIDPGNTIATSLVSVFQEKLLSSTILLKHWAGRNSRGVTQFEGHAINHLFAEPSIEIDMKASQKFLEELVAL